MENDIINISKNDILEKTFLLDENRVLPKIEKPISQGGFSKFYNDNSFDFGRNESGKPLTYTDEINEFGLDMDLEALNRYISYFLIAVFVIFYLITNFKFWINVINGKNNADLGLFIVQVLSLLTSSIILYFSIDGGAIFQLIAGLSALLFCILFSIYIFKTDMVFYVPTTIILFGCIAILPFKDEFPSVAKFLLLGLVYYVFFMLKLKSNKLDNNFTGKNKTKFIAINVCELIFLIATVLTSGFDDNLAFLKWGSLIGLVAFSLTNIILGYQDRSFTIFYALLISSYIFISLYQLGGEGSFFDIIYDSIVNLSFENNIVLIFLVLSFIAGVCYMNGKRKWSLIISFQIIGQLLASGMFYSIGIRGRMFYIAIGILIGLIFGLIFGEIVGDRKEDKSEKCCIKTVITTEPPTTQSFTNPDEDDLETLETEEENDDIDNDKDDSTEEEKKDDESNKNDDTEKLKDDENDSENDSVNDNVNDNEEESSLDLFGLDED